MGSGGAAATGGAASGGAATGGAATGGAATGGAATGGAATGGAATGGAATGGAGSGGDEGTGGGAVRALTYDEVQYVVRMNCATSLCHGGEVDLVLMDVDENFPKETPYDTLYETMIYTSIPECGDVPLVVPGDPDGSAMIRLFRRECGELVMPDGAVGTPTVNQYITDTFAAWIAEGATM